MKNETPIFGVAGFPYNFKYHELGKKRENIFQWLNILGLEWIELQNTYGIKMKDEQAILYKNLAKNNHISLSIHAPYYITLASSNNEIVKRSQERIIKSFELALKLNSERVIFHPGHFPGNSEDDRIEGLNNLILRLKEISEDLPVDKIKIYPEIAGKKNQLGSLLEVIKICEEVPFARPCLDLAHLHARENGSLLNPENFIEKFEIIEKYLGFDILYNCHIHMYPVDFNSKGEKTHKAFGEKPIIIQNELFPEFNPLLEYYPKAEHFIKAIKIMNIKPIVICEAKNTQEIGAKLMQNLYNKENI